MLILLKRARKEYARAPVDAPRQNGAEKMFEIVSRRKMNALNDDMGENSLRGIKASNKMLTGDKSVALPDRKIDKSDSGGGAEPAAAA